MDRFNDYDKAMYIIVEFPKKWEDIFQEMGNRECFKVSSEPR
jgi:hypothetical protein